MPYLSEVNTLANEGTSGRIIATNDPCIVIKHLWKRNTAHHTTKTHSSKKQCIIQQWANKLCTSKNGFSVLRVPNAWGAKKAEYRMQTIDTKTPIYPDKYRYYPQLISDLKLLYMYGFRDGYYPYDFELYEQEDGTIQMIDFDKFGIWNTDGSVLMSWGDTWDEYTVQKRIMI
jgi:hypothetical protein